MAETADRTWTHDDLVAEGLDPKGYEIAAGEPAEASPLSLDGAALAVRLGALLDAHAQAHDAGRVYASFARFLLAEEPRTERLPDVSFIAAERLPAPGATLFPGAPDLAVEVLSPTDGTAAMREKGREYLAAGGREVWVVDPALEIVTVLRSDSSPRAYSAGDVLETEVLPGLALAVGQLFA